MMVRCHLYCFATKNGEDNMAFSPLIDITYPPVNILVNGILSKPLGT